MLHWGPLDPLRLLFTNKLLFSILIPNEYPLTPFYPCTTQSPLTVTYVDNYRCFANYY